MRKSGDKLPRLDQTTAHPSRPKPAIASQSNPAPRPAASVRAQPSSSYTTNSKPIARNGTQAKPSAPVAVATPSAPAKAPKKGSFADIMARGKAAQASLGQIGRIQHKPVERQPTKKERDMQKTVGGKKVIGSQSGRDASGKDIRRKGQALPARNGLNGRGTGSRDNEKVEPEPAKKVKKAATATTGYTGTARPNPAAMKKSAAPARPAPRPSYRRSPDYDVQRRYRYAASEDEEEEEEDDQGYNSEASSDMEAAAYEVDEEEEAAARIARKEDELALKEENRLKEEKRRRLAAMAAKQRR